MNQYFNVHKYIALLTNPNYIDTFPDERKYSIVVITEKIKNTLENSLTHIFDEIQLPFGHNNLIIEYVFQTHLIPFIFYKITHNNYKVCVFRMKIHLCNKEEFSMDLYCNYIIDDVINGNIITNNIFDKIKIIKPLFIFLCDYTLHQVNELYISLLNYLRLNLILPIYFTANTSISLIENIDQYNCISSKLDINDTFFKVIKIIFENYMGNIYIIKNNEFLKNTRNNYT